MNSGQENLEPLRYERKFLVSEYSFSDLRQMLHFHPSCFKEIHSERRVNNIYFDTLGLDHYFDNVEGSSERMKMRIRWYGELFGKVEKPILEYKIKKGLMGKKESFPLETFTIAPGFNKEEIAKAAKGLPSQIKNQLLTHYPTLLNTYCRRYYLSADKRFRITLDHQLTYYKIAYSQNTFINEMRDNSSVVLELKYDRESELDADLVSGFFPFAVTKSSKYLQGLERTLNY